MLICVNPTLPPTTSVADADASTITGVNIDLARALARYWHTRLVVTPTDFIGLFPGMAAQRCGMPISDIIGLPGVRRSLSSSIRREDQVVQQFPIGRAFAFASQDVGFYYRRKQLHGKSASSIPPFCGLHPPECSRPRTTCDHHGGIAG